MISFEFKVERDESATNPFGSETVRESRMFVPPFTREVLYSDPGHKYTGNGKEPIDNVMKTRTAAGFCVSGLRL